MFVFEAYLMSCWKERRLKEDFRLEKKQDQMIVVLGLSSYSGKADTKMMINAATP